MFDVINDVACMWKKIRYAKKPRWRTSVRRHGNKPRVVLQVESLQSSERKCDASTRILQYRRWKEM